MPNSGFVKLILTKAEAEWLEGILDAKLDESLSVLDARMSSSIVDRINASNNE